MASCAPSTEKLAVMVWKPSGTGLTLLIPNLLALCDLGDRVCENLLAVLLRDGDHPFSVADVPAARGQRVAGEDDAGEAGEETFELVQIAAARALQDGAAGEAVGAQPVQDRAVEAAELRHRRIGVQRVDVAGEAVEQRLLARRLLDHFEVRRARRRLQLGRLGAALAAEASLAADE